MELLRRLRIRNQHVRECLLLTYRWSIWRDLLFLVVVLIFELFGVYIAGGLSSLDEHALRDIGRELIISIPYLSRWFENVFIRAITPEVEIFILIWVLCGLCMGHQGHKSLQRGVRTIAIIRALRIITYLSTVLPSPRPGCYMFRFHNVPPLFSSEWFWFVLTNGIPIGGGCKDLLYSGHMAMTVTIGCCYLTLFRSWKVRCFFVYPYWYFMMHKAVRTVLGYHHYSVDMIVALYVVPLVYHFPLISAEPEDLKVFSNNNNNNTNISSTTTTTNDGSIFDPEYGKVKVF